MSLVWTPIQACAHTDGSNRLSFRLDCVITALSATYPPVRGQTSNAKWAQARRVRACARLTATASTLLTRSAQRAVVAMIFLVSANYSALLGPMTWIIPPEYFNTAVRVCLYSFAAEPIARLTQMHECDRPRPTPWYRSSTTPFRWSSVSACTSLAYRPRPDSPCPYSPSLANRARGHRVALLHRVSVRPRQRLPGDNRI